MSGAGPAASVPFDARPLIEPVRTADIRAFTNRLRAEGRLGSPFSGTQGVQFVLLIVVGGVFALVFLSIFGTIAGAMMTSGSVGWLFVLPVLLVLAAIGGIVWLVIRPVPGRTRALVPIGALRRRERDVVRPDPREPRTPGHDLQPGGFAIGPRPRSRCTAALRRVRQLPLCDRVGKKPVDAQMGLRRHQARRAAAAYPARRGRKQRLVRLEPADVVRSRSATEPRGRFR